MVDRVLIFGDSITQGMWDRKGGWAQRLIDDYFSKQMGNMEADVPALFNLGVSADTTENLLARFEHEATARKRPELAFVFAIGTNDSRIDGKTPFSSPERYAANLGRLIEQAKQFVDMSRILFVGLQPCDEARTTPVSWRDTTYTNERLKLFDQALQKACNEHDVAYVPIFNAYQKAQKNSADMLIDGLHPDDAGHEHMYALISPYLADILK